MQIPVLVETISLHRNLIFFSLSQLSLLSMCEKLSLMCYLGGTRQRSLLSHYATSRKIAGSIPDEVTGFFN
jgi:hypothetical protein